MKKILEAELREVLKEYREKELEIKLEGSISGNIHIDELGFVITPNKMIFIDEKEGIIELEIETFMVYSILFNEKRKTIEIKLDNDENIRLEL